MAKPMSPTPEVKGRIARQIRKELRNGTPNTKKRIETITRAVEVFRRSQANPL
jgi:hypothetical protein